MGMRPFKNHLCHMEYAKLKSRGLPIGSGAVESGIRRVINLRLKGPGIFIGMADSADAMLHAEVLLQSWTVLLMLVINMAY